MINRVIFLSAAFFCLIPPFSHAKYQVEFNPSVSISELYDDNIDLDRANEKTDWLTYMSPNISLNVDSEKGSLLLNYGPKMVRYKNEYQNNTIRHSGGLTLSRELPGNLQFNLTDTYLKSEEPVEETEDIYIVRETRNVYMRNNGAASVTYLFGPENSVRVGYNYSLLKNRDITLEDNTIYYPSGGLTYWPNVNNGIELSYHGLLVNYSRGGEEISRASLSGDTAGIKYLRRFGTHSTAFGGYTYNSRFTGQIKDYDIHEASIGFAHDFSSSTSLSFSGGYFQLKDELSGDDNGYSYDVSFIKGFQYGNITLGGSGGWREGYMEVARRGFTKYWGIDSTFNYQVLEKLSNYGRLYCMFDKYSTGQKSKSYRANYGWRFSFQRWFALSLEYSYLTREEDLDIGDYKVNRIMMTLTTSRAFR